MSHKRTSREKESLDTKHQWSASVQIPSHYNRNTIITRFFCELLCSVGGIESNANPFTDVSNIMTGEKTPDYDNVLHLKCSFVGVQSDRDSTMLVL